VKVLVADDEKNIRDSIAEFLKIEGMETRLAADGAEARRLLEEDVSTPLSSTSGWRACREIEPSNGSGQRVRGSVIMLSAYGGGRDAVGALKLGGAITSSNPRSEELSIRPGGAGRRLVARAVRTLRIDDGWVGDGAAMLKSAARSEGRPRTHVALTGEVSGTGKEVVAGRSMSFARENGPCSIIWGLPKTSRERFSASKRGRSREPSEGRRALRNR
jgi:DNA-binding NtrC family response regulator